MDGADGRIVVLGIGNSDRGDDGVGRYVARAVAQRCRQDVVVLEHSGEGASLLEAMAGAGRIFVVDACRSGAPAGTVHRFDVTDQPLPACGFGLSSHGFGLPEAIELARALDQLPRQCVVYAIEGADFGVGAPLSPPVRGVVGEAADRLVAELEERQTQGERRHA